jgi:uncharacterized protein with FMN-binding domain
MQDFDTPNKNNAKIYAILVVGLIAVVLVVARQFTPQEETLSNQVNQPLSEQTNSENPGGTVMTGSETGIYQDGTYEVMGEYMSPGGPEQIAVKLTLSEGQIAAAEVQPQAERPNSVIFQGIFAENYQEFVLGKNIDELKLDKVAGSSLTPKGFNDALEKIKAEAQSAS